MEKRKYLFVVGQLGHGGLERQLYYICTQLVETGHEVHVVCWNCETSQFYYPQFRSLLKDQLIGYNVNESKKTKLKHLRKIILKSEFTHIISFSDFTNFLTSCCAFGTNSKVFGSLRTSLLFYLKKQKLKALLNLSFPKKILVNSMAAIEEGKQNKLLSLRTEFSLLQNVIDIETVLKKSEEGHMEASKEYFNTISVGNVKEAKRLDRLVNLFKFIKNTFPEMLIKHVHIGGGDIEWLQKLIEENKLENYIVLKGQKNNVYPYIKNADIMLHFSDVEGASNAIMEGMCLSKPVVSTNCGDTSLYVKNNVNGYVFDTFSEAAFTEVILKLIKDKETLCELSRNSFNEIKKYDIGNALHFFEKAVNE